MRVRVSIFVLLVVVSPTAGALAAAPLSASTVKDQSLDQLVERAQTARPEDQPALYIEIARQQADAADKLYIAGNTEEGAASLKDTVVSSRKAADASIATGKRLKGTEIALRKIVEKFRDVKRTVAFEDQASIQQALDELEAMRTDLLAAMFGKKKRNQ